MLAMIKYLLAGRCLESKHLYSILNILGVIEIQLIIMLSISDHKKFPTIRDNKAVSVKCCLDFVKNKEN